MHAKLLFVFALLSLVAFVASCGGSDRGNQGYVDPYESEVTGRKKAPPAPAGMGAGDMAATPGAATGDATGGGAWAERKFAGSGQEGYDTLTKGDYEKMKQVGQDYNEARKLYQEYFKKKESGQDDKSTLERAISLYDQLMTQLESMQEAHPDNKTVEEYFVNVSSERRNLLLER